jgi:hypothetical protein
MTVSASLPGAITPTSPARLTVACVGEDGLHRRCVELRPQANRAPDPQSRCWERRGCGVPRRLYVARGFTSRAAEEASGSLAVVRVSYVMICSPIAIICQPLPQPSAQSVPLVDAAAREMNIDPAEVRRRNFIPRDAYPYRTPVGARLFDPVLRFRGRSSSSRASSARVRWSRA